VTPDQISKWLQAIGTKAVEGQGTDWVHASCPFASWRHQHGQDEHPSFGVKPGPGESRCYCLACDWSGTQTDALMLLHEHGVVTNYVEALALIEEAEDGAPLVGGAPEYEEKWDEKPPEHIYPEYLLEAFEEAYDEETGAVHPYLKGRDTPYEVAAKLDLRWDAYRRRILFPVRDGLGRLRGLHGRAVEFPAGGPEWEHDKPYKMYPFEGQTNAHVWLGEHWAEGDRLLVVAESVFDLARVLEVYDNVIAPLSATLSLKKIARIRNAEQIVTIFDEDKAGKRARAKLDYYLTDTDLIHIRLEPGQDAGDLSHTEMKDLLAYYAGFHL